MTHRNGKTAFVPNGDDARDTAIILVGTAQEHGLSDAVFMTSEGYYISDELADALGSEADVPPEPTEVEKVEDQIDAEDGTEVSGEEVADAAVVAPAKKAAKSSGNRAVKQNSTKEE